MGRRQRARLPCEKRAREKAAELWPVQALARTCKAITAKLRKRSIAFGEDEIGLMETALRPAISPASTSATSSANLARKRLWVSAEKSGAGGSSPASAASVRAFVDARGLPSVGAFAAF